MSANSDTNQMIDYAQELGLTVEKAKHGGYVVLDGEAVVCRIHTGSKQPHNWKKATKRRLARWVDRV